MEFISDARILMGLLNILDKDLVQRERMILALNNAINAFFRGSEKRSARVTEDDSENLELKVSQALSIRLKSFWL